MSNGPIVTEVKRQKKKKNRFGDLKTRTRALRWPPLCERDSGRLNNLLQCRPFDRAQNGADPGEAAGYYRPLHAFIDFQLQQHIFVKIFIRPCAL